MKSLQKRKGIYGGLLLICLFLVTGCTTVIPPNNAPVIHSIPVTTALVGAAYNYNVEATDPDGDALAYSLVAGPMGMTIHPSTGLVSWIPSTSGDYNVSVRVSDGSLFDTQNFTISVYLVMPIPLSAPQNVSATDNLIAKIRVTWDSVSGATHYQVYRSGSLAGFKTIVSTWKPGTTFDDTSVTPGTTYWYWVKAAASNSGLKASTYSNPDSGQSVVIIVNP